MGALGDNLLKLTEFPFSYSFIGLVALILGEGINFGDEEFFNRLGPLLILMGFVATTLSITDPIGALQKRLLRGFSREPQRLAVPDPKPTYPKPTVPSFYKLSKEELEIHLYILQKYVEKHILNLRIFGHSGDDISHTVLVCLSYNFQDVLKEVSNNGNWTIDNRHSFYEIMGFEVTWPAFNDIAIKLFSLKQRTVSTTWIVREIDKITGMFYFIVVILTFVIALSFVEGFEDKFLVTFQGGNQTGNSEGATAGDSTNSTTAVEDRLLARTIIIIISIGALVGVSFMLYKRLSELKSKAWTTFRFLIELDTIKIDVKDFEKNLQDIERYLTNGDWTLADYWTDVVMRKYEGAVRKSLGKKKDS